MVLKIEAGNTPNARLLVAHNKKGDFVVRLGPTSGAAHSTMLALLEGKGIHGRKAYFTAELRSPDELVVKTEVLAAQEF